MALRGIASKRKAVLEKREAAQTRLVEWNRAIGRAMGIIRRQRCPSMDEFAERLGWHRSKLSKIEGGKKQLHVSELVQMLGALGILDVPDQPEELTGPLIGWIMSSKSLLPFRINSGQIVNYTVGNAGP